MTGTEAEQLCPMNASRSSGKSAVARGLLQRRCGSQVATRTASCSDARRQKPAVSVEDAGEDGRNHPQEEEPLVARRLLDKRDIRESR